MAAQGILTIEMTMGSSSNGMCEEGAVQCAGASRTAAPLAGREYFEDLCMKAVNQCIGRVIRHRGDWAAILLVDQRWTSAPSAGNTPSPLQATKLMHHSDNATHKQICLDCSL